MTTKSISDMSTVPRSLFQSNILTSSIHLPLKTSQSRDYSSTSRDPYFVDNKLKRVSPHQERFFALNASQIASFTLPLSHTGSNPLIPQSKNDYGLSTNRSYITNSQATERDQEIEKRLQEMSSKVDKMEMRMEHHQLTIQAFNNQYRKRQEVESLRIQFQSDLSCKENIFNSQNHHKLTQIQEIKSKLRNFPLKQDIQRQMLTLDSSIKILINSIKTTLTSEITQSQSKMKKKFIEVIVQQINQKLEHHKENSVNDFKLLVQKMISESNIKQAVKEHEFEPPFSISDKIFIGAPSMIKIREILTSVQGSHGVKQVQSVQTTYYIDSDGFLLDNNKGYIVDKSGHQVKLSLAQIALLRQNKLLS